MFFFAGLPRFTLINPNFDFEVRRNKLLRPTLKSKLGFVGVKLGRAAKKNILEFKNESGRS